MANPVDMIASADAARYRAVLERVRRDPGVDGIIAIFVSPIMIDAYEVARAIADCADGSKPMLSVFMGKQRSREGGGELRRRRVPVYRFPEEAASAMSAMARYRTPARRARRVAEWRFACQASQARSVQIDSGAHARPAAQHSRRVRSRQCSRPTVFRWHPRASSTVRPRRSPRRRSWATRWS